MLLKSENTKDYRALLMQYIKGTLLGMPTKKKRPKLLLVVPDDSRFHSGAPAICETLYLYLKESHDFSFLIATGTHEGMSKKRIENFYKNIPSYLFKNHDFRSDCVYKNSISKEEIKKLTNVDFPFNTEISVSKALFDENYDLILSIGQVVPHEVCGFSNYTKNLVIGLGSKDIIDKTHYLSALVGIENIMGEAFNPARLMVDYAMEKLNVPTPVHYILSVVDSIKHHIDSLYIANQDEGFFLATQRSKKINLFKTEKRFNNVYASMGNFFKTTWIANKAIYRLRKIVADGGKLHIIAPKVSHFGEDPIIDEIIQTHGYPSNSEKIKRLENELSDHLAVLAHLMHSCPEDRFEIIYYLEEESIKTFKSSGFHLETIENAPQLSDINDSESFVCLNPSLGLWAP